MSEIDKRVKRALELYEGGMTLQEVSDVFKFSRQRAQQLIIKGIQKRISKEFDFRPSTQQEIYQLDIAAKEVMRDIYLINKEIRKKQKKNDFLTRIQSRMNELPDYSKFPTLNSYARALGVKMSDVQKYFPNQAKEIVQKTKNRWSRHYNKCRTCGTTSTKHRSNGLCRDCYLKSDIFKDLNASSRLRNQEKWRERQKKYAREYSKRPEVVSKRKKQWDQENFGGNREKALRRDKYKCRICFITQDGSIKKLGKDLFVVHLNGTKNHNLDNLMTLCEKCHNKRIMKIMRGRLAEKIQKKD